MWIPFLIPEQLQDKSARRLDGYETPKRRALEPLLIHTVDKDAVPYAPLRARLAS